MHQHGLLQVYDCGADYLPLYQYVLWIYTKIAGSEAAIAANIHYLKLFTLLIDLLGVWYIYKWIDKKMSYAMLAIILILNIGYSYNSLVWGQVDGILAALVFISFYYADKDRMIESAVFFALALNFKLHAVVFLPIWGLMYLNGVIIKPSPKRILMPAVALGVTTLIAWLPFAMKPGGVQQILSVVVTSVDRFPKVGQGSRGVWDLALSGNTMDIVDSGKWKLGLTYKQWGLLMFFGASFILLLPLVVRLVKNMMKREDARPLMSREQLWLYCALVIMLFFFLNTQMHERYVHPALIFVAAYSFYRRDYFPFVVLSVVYLLNLEGIMQAAQLDKYSTLIFMPEFQAGLYAVVIIYLWWRLVRMRVSPLAS